MDFAQLSLNQERRPAERVASPASRGKDAATVVAFRNARDTYRKSLSEKDLQRISVPAEPEDVLNEIEKW